LEGLGEAMARTVHEHSVYAGYGKILPQVEMATKIISADLNSVGAEAFADKLSKKVASIANANDVKKYASFEQFGQKLRSAYVVGKLGFRISSALVQAYSSMLYTANVENASTRAKLWGTLATSTVGSINKLVRAKGDMLKAYSEMFEKSVTMRARFDTGFSADLTENSTTSDFKRILKEVVGSENAAMKLSRVFSAETSMEMIKVFDGIAMYQGWEMAKKEVSIERSDLDVDTEAYWDEVTRVHDDYVRQSQSTSSELDNVGYQDAPMFKMVIMFATARAKQWQMMRRIIWDIKNGNVAKGVEAGIAIVLMQALTEATKMALRVARGGEEPEEPVEDLLAATGISMLQQNIFFGDYVAQVLVPVINFYSDGDIRVFDRELATTEIVHDINKVVKGVMDEDNEKLIDGIVGLSSATGMPAEGVNDIVKIINNYTE
jgi:hypothetical protein